MDGSVDAHPGQGWHQEHPAEPWGALPCQAPPARGPVSLITSRRTNPVTHTDTAQTTGTATFPESTGERQEMPRLREIMDITGHD